ncbi:MAG: toprim domain-containing protein [Lentisphaerae bacterium]|nr:toprim domain-containing protein [Lentisphaerota bacterium]
MKTFTEYRIQTRQNSGEEACICPECNQQRKSQNRNKRCLCVNHDKGVWMCQHCGWKGGLGEGVSFLSQINKPVQTVKKAYKKPEVQPMDANEPIYQWFEKQRFIGRNVIEREDVGFHNGAIAFSYFKNGELVNIKYRAMQEKKFWQSGNGEPVVYRYDKVMRHFETATDKTLIIVEGEMDALAFVSQGFENVVSVPMGSSQGDNLDGKFDFLESSEELFMQADKFVMCLDSDEVGQFFQNEMVRRLGSGKCFKINLHEHKDANDVILNGHPTELIELYKEIEGYEIEGVDSWRNCAESVITGQLDNNTGVDMGFTPAMNEHCRLVQGGLYVITGIPQSGKSEWIENVMCKSNINHNWKWAIFSPEYYPLENMAVKLLEKYYGQEYTKMSQQTRMKGMATFIKNIFPIKPSEDDLMGVDSLMEILKQLVFRYGIKGFILDPYNEVKVDSSVSETQFINDFLTRIRNFGKKYGVAMCVVAHPTKMQKDSKGNYPVPTPYDISGSANWRNKADFCISIWRDFNKDDGEVFVYVQKVRWKNSGKNGCVKLFFNKKTNTYHGISNRDQPPQL